MWAAGQRLLQYRKRKGKKAQTPVILHFGDHDPSGIDMTRDIQDRLELFMGGLEVRRLALTMGQVEEYEPPPNPAKLTDSRVGAYLRDFGNESWELDALEPSVLAGLIRAEVESLMDEKRWAASNKRETEARQQLGEIATRYNEVADFLGAES